MSTATQPRPATVNGQEIDEKQLLELMLDMAVTEQTKQISEALDKRQQEVEYLLPDFMKGQAKRLIKRARLTFAGNERLQECTPASFIKCVLQAAEMGFAIDGRLCHAVPYKKSWKDKDGRWQNQYEAQTQVDYKGMIAHAKRLHLIQDCWARMVHEKDHFRFMEKNGVVDYEFAFSKEGDRGAKIGAYAVATHKDGWTRFDWMSLGDIHKIRARSKSWGEEGGKGPWHTDPDEMEKKTPIKRMLKTLTDDAGLVRMLEIDDQDTDLSIDPNPIDTTERPSVNRAALEQIVNRAALEQIVTNVAPRKQEPADPEPAEPKQTRRRQQAEQQSPKDQPKETAPAKTETQLVHPAGTSEAFAKYRTELEACDNEQQCRQCYDKWFGPDSTVEFSAEQNAEAVAMRDAMIAHLAKTSADAGLPERMRLLKEKILSYKQPARLAGLLNDIATDQSYSDEEKEQATEWVKHRVSVLQGTLPGLPQ